MQEVTQVNERPTLSLQSFTHLHRALLLPALDQAIERAGGWFLDRHALSATALTIDLEVQLLALPELYAALLATGLELTRESHRKLAERCNCSLHRLPRQRSCLSMQLEIYFLAEPPRIKGMSGLVVAGTASA